MNKIQQYRFEQHRHTYQATHAKTLGVAKDTLAVPSELPEHLHRSSCAWEDCQCGTTLDHVVFDSESLVLKARHRCQQDATTQDFFFNNAPMIQLTENNAYLQMREVREVFFNSPTMLAAAT